MHKNVVILKEMLVAMPTMQLCNATMSQQTLPCTPPPELPRVGSFFSYRCLVFPKKCPQRKACAFRSYLG